MFVGGYTVFTLSESPTDRLSETLYPPQTVFVGGYTVFTLSESPTDRVSETFCFINNFKSH